VPYVEIAPQENTMGFIVARDVKASLSVLFAKTLPMLVVMKRNASLTSVRGIVASTADI
jgi:hypothetical protein